MGLDAELLFDPRAVGADGFRTDEHGLGDGGCCEAAPECSNTSSSRSLRASTGEAARAVVGVAPAYCMRIFVLICSLTYIPPCMMRRMAAMITESTSLFIT